MDLKKFKLIENLKDFKYPSEVEGTDMKILSRLERLLSKVDIVNEFGDENSICVIESGLDFSITVNNSKIIVSRYFSPSLNEEDIKSETEIEYEWQIPSKSVLNLLKEYNFKDKYCYWCQFNWTKTGFKFIPAIYEIFTCTWDEEDVDSIVSEISSLYNDKTFFGRYFEERETLLHYIKSKGQDFYKNSYGEDELKNDTKKILFFFMKKNLKENDYDRLRKLLEEYKKVYEVSYNIYSEGVVLRGKKLYLNFIEEVLKR